MLRINCLSGSAQLFHTAQDHLPMDGAPYSELDPLTSISNQDNFSEILTLDERSWWYKRAC